MIEELLWKFVEEMRVISTFICEAPPLNNQSKIVVFLTFQVHKLPCLAYLLVNLTKTRTVSHKL